MKHGNIATEPTSVTKREAANRCDSVLFFVNTTARFATDFGAVVRAIVASGIPAKLYAPEPPSGSAWWDRVQINGQYELRLPAALERHALPFERARLNSWGVLRTLYKIFQIGVEAPHALPVFWTVLPILLGGLPMRLLQRPCVFMVTGLGSVFGSDRWQMRLARPLVKLAYRYLFCTESARVIVHNSEDKQYLVDELKVRPEHIQVTPGCGVDPREFPFFETLPRRSNKIILVPARLLVEKGIFDAVEASTHLRKQGIVHEMWLSCSPDDGNPSALSSADLARIQQENDWVKCVGHHDSLVPLYENCDIVCVPTKYREGLPTALIEASACGRPIVTTDNVGCREIIHDGETGLVVPPGSPQALAAALSRLIKDADLAETLRRNAYQQFLRGFTKDVMVTQTLRIFRELGLSC